MIGERISHYILEEKLGSGTYGSVYRAVHAHDDELEVAIKVLHPALVGDANFVQSLRTECRSLDKMDHANIVRFRDLVMEPQLAVVLELLVGADLATHIAKKPISIGDGVAILESVLQGMAYAHERNVIHRDIKPSNVFLCSDGRVKVLDFGIARAADNTQATKTGQLSGTLDYIAPERFTSGGGGPGADVYGIGLLAWEMLAGRPACPDGDLARKMGWHMGVGADDVRTLRGDAPDWLAAVVQRLCQRDRGQRPATAKEALDLFLKNRPTGFEDQQSLTDPRGRVPGTNPPGTVTLDKGSLPPAEPTLPPPSPPPVAPPPPAAHAADLSLEQKPPEPEPVQASAPAPPAPEPPPSSPPPPDNPPPKKGNPLAVGGAIAAFLGIGGFGLLCCGGAGFALMNQSADMEGTWSGICKAAYSSDPDYIMPLPVELTIYSQDASDDLLGMLSIEFSSEYIAGDASGWVSDDYAYINAALTYSSDTIPMTLSGQVNENVMQGTCSIDMSGESIGGEMTLAKRSY